MSEGNEQVKNRLSLVVDAVKTVFHWGFIPGVIYLGKHILWHILKIELNLSNVFRI